MEFIYNPDLMPESELKATFVARQSLVDELVTSIIKQGAQPHILIQAPRGMGKTTLLLMLRLAFLEGKHSEHYQPIKFPEESYGIYDIADFLIETLNNLASETRDMSLLSRGESLKSAGVKNNKLEELAIGVIRQWQKTSNKKLVLLIENFDQILDQLGDETSIKRLMKILSHENSIILVACSTTYFNDDHKPLLSKLFSTVELKAFGFRDIQELLIRRAKQDGNPNFKEVVEANRSRLRVLEYFTGGNPRLVLMLYRVLTNSDITQVRQALEKLLDEITPYYKSKIESLAPQQRKIIDQIARASGKTGVGITPSDIAEAIRLTPNQVSAQLKRLSDIGYVRAANISGRKSYYTLAQPLFAVWHQMRLGKDTRQRMIWFIDFLKGWYELEELQQRALEQAEKFRLLLREGRLNEARQALEYHRYLAEAMQDGTLKAKTLSSIIKEYLEMKDKETVQSELLSRIELHLLSEDTRLDLHHAGLITFQQLYNFPMPLPASKEAISLAEADAANELGLAALRTENLEEALIHFKRAIEIKDDYFRSWRNCGITLSSLDRYNEALECYERVLELNPSIPSTWVSRGNILRKLGNYQEAVNCYDHALVLEPDNFETLYNRGLALWESKQLEASLKSFNKALEIRPLSRRALAFQTAILNDLGRGEEAIKAIDQAIRINPDFKEGWSIKGLVCFMSRNYGEAIKSYERALELGQDFTKFAPDYITALVEAGRHEYGWTLAQQYLKKYPDEPSVLLAAGIALNHQDKYEEALNLFNHLIEIKSDLDKAWTERGYSLQQLNRGKEAIESYDKALELTPDLWDANFLRAYIYNAMFASSVEEQDSEQATQYWREVIKVLDTDEPLEVFLMLVESHWPKLIQDGYSAFLRQMIIDSGLEDRLFPLVKAIDYLLSNDKAVLETLSPEYRSAVELVVKRFSATEDE